MQALIRRNKNLEYRLDFANKVTQHYCDHIAQVLTSAQAVLEHETVDKQHAIIALKHANRLVNQLSKQLTRAATKVA